MGKRGNETDLNYQGTSKRARYEESRARYAEFGENDKVEFYDSERKMRKYKAEIENGETEGEGKGHQLRERMGTAETVL